MRTSLAVLYSWQLPLSIAASSLSAIHWANINSDFPPILGNATCKYNQRHDHNQLLTSSFFDTCPQVTESFSREKLDGPWTYGPGCASLNASEYMCGYTNPTHSNGRGLTIFTKPHIAKTIASRLSDPLEATETRPPYDIKPLPGRGFGVVANRTIIKGEVIFAWPIVGIFRNSAFVWPGEKPYEDMKRSIHQAVSHLPQASQHLIFKLGHHDPNADPLLGILDTNTFAAEFGGEDHMVIVPETARMNHDCRPKWVVPPPTDYVLMRSARCTTLTIIL